MDAKSTEQARQRYTDLLLEAHAVAERLRERLRQLRERFPDVPPDVLGEEILVRVDPPHSGEGAGGLPHGESGSA